MSLTAQTIIDGAFDLCNVKQPGESLTTADNNDALRRLNNFVKILNNQSLISPFIERQVWPLVSGQNTYTIGPGGDFDTPRPFELEGAAILLNPTITSVAITGADPTLSTFTVAGNQTSIFVSGADFDVQGSSANDGSYTTVSSVFGTSTDITVIETVPDATADGTITVFTETNSTIEIPRSVITDDAYAAIQVKALTPITIPTAVYFNANFGRGLASVYLWPTPSVATNALVLYRRSLLNEFADLDTEYEFPQGFEELFEYGLAKRLLTPYAVSDQNVRSDIMRGAAESMMIVKRTNNKPNDMPIDPAWTHDRRFGYNINTGNA